MYSIGDEFFIIGEKNTFKKHVVCGKYIHTREGIDNEYFVFQSEHPSTGENIIMTIVAENMYKTEAEAKQKAIKVIDEKIKEFEEIKKNII